MPRFRGASGASSAATGHCRCLSGVPPTEPAGREAHGGRIAARGDARRAQAARGFVGHVFDPLESLVPSLIQARATHAATMDAHLDPAMLVLPCRRVDRLAPEPTLVGTLLEPRVQHERSGALPHGTHIQLEQPEHARVRTLVLAVHEERSTRSGPRGAVHESAREMLAVVLPQRSGDAVEEVRSLTPAGKIHPPRRGSARSAAMRGPRRRSSGRTRARRPSPGAPRGAAREQASARREKQRDRARCRGCSCRKKSSRDESGPRGPKGAFERSHARPQRYLWTTRSAASTRRQQAHRKAEDARSDGVRARQPARSSEAIVGRSSDSTAPERQDRRRGTPFSNVSSTTGARQRDSIRASVSPARAS